MIILGLTGSIGMGKTTASDNFRRLGLPVHSSDEAVHQMMSRDGEAFTIMSDMFPAAARKFGIDRKVIAQEAFSNRKILNKIEKVLHPLVIRREKLFLNHCARRRNKMVVLDVPLLFETGGENRCDGVITVSAPSYVQRQRVINRPSMTHDRLQYILARQVSDKEKKRRSDFVILTGLGKRFSFIQVQKIVSVTKRWQGKHWPM
mgnify:CR=1 FL=1